MDETSPPPGEETEGPANLELEVVVLAAATLSQPAYLAIAPILSDETFSDATHRMVWRTLRVLYDQGEAVGEAKLSTYLTSDPALREAGVAKYIKDMIAGMAAVNPSIATVLSHARFLRDLWVRREALVAIKTAATNLNVL